MKVVYAERARRDIVEIYDYNARHSEAGALHVEELIRATCERLADFPLVGVATDVVNVRRLPLVRYPYAIFYRVDEAGGRIEIARVIHGARLRHLDQLPDD